MGTINPKVPSVDPQLSLPELPEGAVPGARRRVFLLPGQLHASAEPCQITTILGSCVAICLHDATRFAGGMNHFLLPLSKGAEAESLRFADHATLFLLEKMLVMGCRLPNLTAKIFGGAALFQSKGQYRDSLGAKNVAAAIELLKNAGIPIVARETGGKQGRKVIFDTEEGAAWVRRV